MRTTDQRMLDLERQLEAERVKADKAIKGLAQTHAVQVAAIQTALTQAVAALNVKVTAIEADIKILKDKIKVPLL